MTRHDYARSLRDIGLSVFPIPAGQKVPTVSWKPLQDRLATDDELRAWFPDGTTVNLGIVTGAVSGIVVMDADSQAAAEYLWDKRVPATSWYTQTARGWHFYFAHPGGQVQNRGTDVHTSAGPLPIHIRGDGGYVLGDGSSHPSGVLYRSTVGAPRPALARYWPGWLPRETRTVTGTTSSARNFPPPPVSDSSRLLIRARCYLAVIPRPEIGQGSDTQVFKAACRLVRGLALPPADAEAVLWDWCGNRDGWTREWVASKVASAARRDVGEPIGGLR